jgi:hypothetical protein
VGANIYQGAPHSGTLCQHKNMIKKKSRDKHSWQKRMQGTNQGILKGEVSLYRWPPVWLVWNQLTIFVFYLQNRLIQTGQTGGQQYSDTSPLVFPGQTLKPIIPASKLQTWKVLLHRRPIALSATLTRETQLLLKVKKLHRTKIRRHRRNFVKIPNGIQIRELDTPILRRKFVQTPKFLEKESAR